jgi:undecaprenyl-diphosphatase
LGAAVLELPHLIRAGINSSVIIGILSSMVFGYLAIKYMLKFLEHYGYGVFFWYRLLLGVAVVAVYLFR